MVLRVTERKPAAYATLRLPSQPSQQATHATGQQLGAKREPSRRVSRWLASNEATIVTGHYDYVLAMFKRN